MEKRNVKKKIFKSIEKFEKEFFPNSYKEKILESITDPRILGANLAKECLDLIDKQLSK